MPEIIMGDHFYVDLPSQEVEWIYYNPDSASGGQYVINNFSRRLFDNALRQFQTPEEIFDHIGSLSKQYLADRNTQYFHVIRERLATEKPDITGAGCFAVDQLSLLFIARDLIDEYCQEEFGSNATFVDMHRIGIGYTTTEDGKHEVQAYANLVDYRLECCMDNAVVIYRKFDSLKDMVDHGLCNLSFDELTDIPEWVIEDHERAALIEDLAVRLTFFAKEHDTYHYQDAMEIGETDADMVSHMRSDLSDPDLIRGIMEELETIVKDGNLSDADKAKCYDMMTDLYHLFAEEMFVPVYDRETDILYTTFDVLGLEGYELSFDNDGICMKKGDAEWHDADIYRYLAQSISVETCREFRDKSFMNYTDFKDLAAHYGVRIGTRFRQPPVARLDFLGSNGAVGDSVEYYTEAAFLKALKEELQYGVPLTVVLYRDDAGKTLSRNFLEDLDTMPKGLTVEDAPQSGKKPAERSDAR